MYTYGTHRQWKAWLLGLATAVLVFGCATSVSPEGDADTQRDALVQRARLYQVDAKQAPESLSPERKAELQELAADIRAWQGRTGRNDINVTDKRATTARRANDTGGAGNCDNDCPVYTFEHDTICFLKGSECSSDPEFHGTICIYTCISIASQVPPQNNQR